MSKSWGEDVGHALKLWFTGEPAKTLVIQRLSQMFDGSVRDQTLEQIVTACLREANDRINGGSVAQPGDWLFSISSLLGAARVLDAQRVTRDPGMLAEFRELLSVMVRELASRSSARTAVADTDARSLLMRGLAAEQAGDFDSAIRSMQQAVAADPHNADAWNSLGWVQWRRGEADEALRCFDRAVAENQHCTMAWVNKGIVLKNVKRYAEALACYERAVSLPGADPEDVKRAWHNMAALYWERGNPGDLNDAQRCVDRALVLDPNYAMAQRLSVAIRARQGRPSV